MHRVKIDPPLSEFLNRIPLSTDGVELEVDGQVVCTIFPPQGKQELEASIRDKALEIMASCQKRNADVPRNVINREIREAISEVRRQERK